MGQANSSYQNLKKYLHTSYIRSYLQKQSRIPEDILNTFSVIDQNDRDRKNYEEIFNEMAAKKDFSVQRLKLKSMQIQKCIASLLGLAICDALGATTQFIPYHKDGLSIIKQGFKDIEVAISNQLLQPRAGKVGIWTDDCSMALCMADSLIYNNFKLQLIHIRYLFLLWFFNGLNNGGRNHSIGLGGNIKISMDQFMHKQTPFCEKGDQFNNGNGSLMRLAPIPIVFRDNKQTALQMAASSSQTTHNGEEAKQCCRLLSNILVNLYKSNSKQPQKAKKILEDTCFNFQSPSQGVWYLAQSMQEDEQYVKNLVSKYGNKFLKHNKQMADRNWNWKDKNFTYSPTRTKEHPGYVGSYCMDALAMALHTVWHTSNFFEVAVMNANMGGDCDTVGAIAGQIAGAMYGLDSKMLRLYSQMDDFKKKRYQVFLKGYKLAHRIP